MSNSQVLDGFKYSLMVVGLIVVLGWWDLSGRVVRLEKEHMVLAQVTEGMCGGTMAYTQGGVQFQSVASDSLIGSQPGGSTFDTSKSAASMGSSDGVRRNAEPFFGGAEPPTFYDIGDVRAARSTRGWKTDYLTDAAGNPVYNRKGRPVMKYRRKMHHNMKSAEREGMWGVAEGADVWTPVDGFTDAQLMQAQG